MSALAEGPGNIGEIKKGDILDFYFTTVNLATGAPTTLTGGVVSIYKNNSTSPTTTGVTLDLDFNSTTGLNHVRVDTTQSTSFYDDACNFAVVITTGTVSAVSAVGTVVGQFSISARSVEANVMRWFRRNVPRPNVPGVPINDVCYSNGVDTSLGAITSLVNGINTNGLQILQNATNQNGLTITGNGTGNGGSITGGGDAAAGHGLVIVGPGTSACGLVAFSGLAGVNANNQSIGFFVKSTNGTGGAFLGATDGILATGSGIGSHGIQITGGNAGGAQAAGDGIHITGGTASANATAFAGKGINCIGGAGAATLQGAGVGLQATAGGTVTVSGNYGMYVSGTGNFPDGVNADVQSWLGRQVPRPIIPGVPITDHAYSWGALSSQGAIQSTVNGVNTNGLQIIQNATNQPGLSISQNASAGTNAALYAVSIQGNVNGMLIKASNVPSPSIDAIALNVDASQGGLSGASYGIQTLGGVASTAFRLQGGPAGGSVSGGSGIQAIGGNANSGAGAGIAGSGFSCVGGAGAATNHGAGIGFQASAGGTITVSGNYGAYVSGTGNFPDGVNADVQSWMGRQVPRPFTPGVPVVDTTYSNGAQVALAGTSSSSAPTVAQIATAVWQDAVAGDFTVASSIGKSLYTSGIVPGGVGGLFISGTNTGPLTVTGGVTFSNSGGDAFTCSSSGSNGNGFVVTGNGSGAGMKATAGATGNGITSIGGATSGDGFNLTCTVGNGINTTGGGGFGSGIQTTSGSGNFAYGMLIQSTGAGNVAGLQVTGNGSGDGVFISGGSGGGHGFRCLGGGAAGFGFLAVGGTGTAGGRFQGGSAAGDGLQCVSTAAGAGLSATGVGSGSGVLATGGNAGGHGVSAQSGTGTTGDGITAVSNASSGSGRGLFASGFGAGQGILSVGGATGPGIEADGGATSGDGVIFTATTSGHGLSAIANGTTKHGINAIGGVTSSDGIRASGGGTGHGFNARSGSGATGNGITGLALSTSGSGMSLTGTGTGSGLLAVRGATGYDFKANFSRASTAQAGGASTITLDAGASAVDNFYNGQTVVIYDGTGAGQAGSITAYVGATKVATVSTAWATVPDNTSVFGVFPAGSSSGGSLTAAQVATAVWQDLTVSSDFTTTGSIGYQLANGGTAVNVTQWFGNQVPRPFTPGVPIVDTTYSDGVPFGAPGTASGISIGTSATGPTAAQIATAVWQDATGTDFNVASSIGKSLYTSGIVPGGAGGFFISGANTGPLSVSGGVTFSNSGGDAFTITSSGGNGNGMNVTGNGTGHGIFTTGGSTSGNGMRITGGGGTGLNCIGGTSGSGMAVTAQASGGHGLVAQGLGAGNGIYGFGGSSGSGLVGNGGSNGHGMSLIGGASSGDGFNSTATGGNGNGIQAIGVGTGAGINTSGGIVGAINSTVVGLTSTTPVTANVTQFFGQPIPRPSTPGIPIVDTSYSRGVPTSLGAIQSLVNGISSNGLQLAQNATDQSAILATGNGLGHGMDCESGTGNNACGIMAESNGASGTAYGLFCFGIAGGARMSTQTSGGEGLHIVGSGNGVGCNIAGGSSGNGLKLAGGASSGDGLNITATSGNGISSTGGGTGAGMTITGGNAGGANPAGPGISITGGAASTSGGGIAGFGLNVVGGAGAASTNGSAIGLKVAAGGTVTVSGNYGMYVSGSGKFPDGVNADVQSWLGRQVPRPFTPGVPIVDTTYSAGVNVALGGTTSSSAPTVAQIATAVWQDAVAGDFTAANSIGKSLYTSGIVPGGAGGFFISGANTGPMSVSGGVTFSNSTGDGFTCSSSGSNGNGVTVSGNGTGDGARFLAGANGNGIEAFGGGSGHGLNLQSGSGGTGNALNAVALSTNGTGIQATGTGTGAGINTGGGVVGAINSTVVGLTSTTPVSANVTQWYGAAIPRPYTPGVPEVDLLGTRGVPVGAGSIPNAAAGATGGLVTTTGGSFPTAAQVATAVWQDATPGDFIVASSIGKSLYTSGLVPGANGGLFISGANTGPVSIIANSASPALQIENTGSGDGVWFVGDNGRGLVIATSGTTSPAMTVFANNALPTLFIDQLGTGIAILVGGGIGSNNPTISVQGGTGNADAVALIGNGTGSGIRAQGGTNGSGLTLFGQGTGAGINATGGVVGTINSTVAGVGPGGSVVNANIQQWAGQPVPRPYTSGIPLVDTSFSRGVPTSLGAIQSLINGISSNGLQLVQNVTGQSAILAVGASGGYGMALSGGAGATSGLGFVTRNVGIDFFPFVMIQAADGKSPVLGATVTGEVSIDGAPFVACTFNPATETGNGWYWLKLAGVDLNGKTIALKLSAAFALDTEFTLLTQPTV